MSEQPHPPGLWPVPGDGVLARQKDLVILSTLESGRLVETLLELLAQVARSGGDGGSLADNLADALDIQQRMAPGIDGPDTENGPSVLAFGPSGTGLAVCVSGRAWAEVSTAGGVQRIAATVPGALLRGVLRAPIMAVHGGLDGAPLRGGDSAAALTDRFSRLDSGTLRASGLAYYPSGSPAAAGAATGGPAGGPASLASPSGFASPPASPVSPAGAGPSDWAFSPARSASAGERTAAATDEDQGAAADLANPYAMGPGGAAGVMPDLGDDATGFGLAGQPGEPEAGPFAGGNGGPAGDSPRQGEIIDGVYCPNGHFEDPEAQTCAVCGVTMNQQTLLPRPGPRPPLGVLTLDDGSAHPLDGDYVAGREPTLDDSVAAGEARALVISDPSGIVSRVHARVHLDGWRVLITDLGSANGTRVIRPQQVEQQLLPKVPVVLAPGSRVDLGGCGFTYESHRGLVLR